MAEIIIIGNGPAGISCALYTVRSGIKTTIVGRDFGALAKADMVENYYGFVEPVSANFLIQSGIDQATRLGCTFINDEIFSLGFDKTLTLKGKLGEYSSDIVVIATGLSRSKPKIARLEEFLGRGVSFCAICDAFFYRGKDVVVIGNGEYAKSEASELLPIVKSVTLLTNGATLDADFPDSVGIDSRKISSITGGDVVSGVEFEDGTMLDASGIFIAQGVANASDLAAKIGAQTKKGYIVTNETMMTNIPDLYAVGDCTGGLLQIAKAVSDGAIAGTSIIKKLRNATK